MTRRDDDERLIRLGRRDFMLAGVAVIAASNAAFGQATCALTPEQEEGPYYIDRALLRQELTEGRVGVPLRLQVRLLDARRCAPIPGAAIDIWHCDALGVYSGFTVNGGGETMGPPGGFGRRGGLPPPPPPSQPPGAEPGRGPFGRGMGPPRSRVTDELRFLRGVQLTDTRGLAEFRTIYPGWYQGRTIHIHAKVHLGGTSANETYGGGHVCHTGLFFFPEDITDEIARLTPYVDHAAVHRVRHAEDNIFLRQGGSQSMLALERITPRSNAGGFVATATLTVDPDATPAVF